MQRKRTTFPGKRHGTHLDTFFDENAHRRCHFRGNGRQHGCRDSSKSGQAISRFLGSSVRWWKIENGAGCLSGWCNLPGRSSGTCRAGERSPFSTFHQWWMSLFVEEPERGTFLSIIRLSCFWILCAYPPFQNSSSFQLRKNVFLSVRDWLGNFACSKRPNFIWYAVISLVGHISSLG